MKKSKNKNCDFLKFFYNLERSEWFLINFKKAKCHLRTDLRCKKWKWMALTSVFFVNVNFPSFLRKVFKFFGQKFYQNSLFQ